MRSLLHAVDGTIAHNNADMHAERIECAQAAVTAGKAAVEVGTATTKSLMPIRRRFVYNETADAREVVRYA